MKTTIEFLDAVKARHGFTSDYQLGKWLNIGLSSVSNYRTKKSHFDEDTCIKIADALDLDQAYVMACIAAERSKSEKAKAVWKHAAELLYGLAAALTVMAILPFVNLPDSGLVRVAEASAQFDQSIHYAK